MAYKLLSLTAISGEFPTDQLNRLPGSPYYLESVITALKKDGLLRTYYRDKLRGYRLGPRAKATLLESRPDRFASYLTGDTDTNRLMGGGCGSCGCGDCGDGCGDHECGGGCCH